MLEALENHKGLHRQRVKLFNTSFIESVLLHFFLSYNIDDDSTFLSGWLIEHLNTLFKAFGSTAISTSCDLSRTLWGLGFITKYLHIVKIVGFHYFSNDENIQFLWFQPSSSYMIIRFSILSFFWKLDAWLYSPLAHSEYPMLRTIKDPSARCCCTLLLDVWLRGRSHRAVPTPSVGIYGFNSEKSGGPSSNS